MPWPMPVEPRRSLAVSALKTFPGSRAGFWSQICDAMVSNNRFLLVQACLNSTHFGDSIEAISIKILSMVGYKMMIKGGVRAAI